ncbi:putative cytochrome P450 [Lyophyllum shimeji]|uniref:Cytochrome P450 n=1 Tax=Lyophyllum shimeji TaxID=47721 RepID=A0A9P3PLL3_LYOSH|nr:putative cytochrome P450 [Lyophyllum shimeji]
MAAVPLLAFSFCILYVLQKFLEYWRATRSIHNHAGYRTLFAQSSVISNFLSPVAGIAPGSNYLFLDKHRMFKYFGCDIHSAVSAWPKPTTTLLLADAAAIKEVCSSRSRFPKPIHHYTLLLFFGRNIVASEGEEWKNYRKISAPAFSDRNNRLVWEETVKIMDSLFKDVWGSQKVITTDHCVEVTLPIALFVIGAAGFGREISWKDDDVLPTGHKLTFKNALHIVTTDIFLKLIVPDRALGLTKRLSNVKLAFEELERYMSEMIKERQHSKQEVRHDLFSNLLDANDEDSGDAKLLVSELIGNIFIFLVAGHETTAHTLCFTFAMLALYPDEQEILYQHIQSVLSSGKGPTYENMPLFTQSMAVFYETLRMFPPVTGIPKESAEDTSLATTDAQGNQVVVPIPKGADITIHVPGLHYNPRYWSKPDSFIPSRFLGDWPRDAFLPFSAGARACLGRKFFETEGIAILTMLMSQYKIEVKEEPQFASETFAQRKARILACRAGLTLTPIRVPLVFQRREQKPF